VTDKDIAVTALKMLTVVPSAVTDPDPGHLTIAQGELRRFIQELALEPLSLYAWARLAFPLAAGISEYTIGPGGDFNTARPPLGIHLWSVVPDRNAADPLELPRRRPDTITQWQRIGVKTATSSFPSRLYYDATIDVDDRSTVAVYPVPDNGNADIVLYVATGVGQMSPTVEYTFPEAYESMLVNGLALRLKKFYPAAPLDRQVAIDARHAKYLIQRANWQAGVYNIYADEYETLP
jgi:hypothetical protein